jgi:hypothetical protein
VRQTTAASLKNTPKIKVTNWGPEDHSFGPFAVRLSHKYRDTRSLARYGAMVELLNTLLSMLVSLGFAVLVLVAISLETAWRRDDPDGSK